MTLTAKDIEILSAPFDEKTLGVKLQSYSKDRTRASLVCYLQHTDVYHRIEAVDPGWKSEILDVSYLGEACFTRMRLTIKGVSRENAGEGDDPKSSASDAIKRCAMLFGVGRYLYDAETVWVPFDEQKDRFRTWTLADYQGALKRGQAPLPTAPTNLDPPVGRRPVIAPRQAEAPRMTKAQMGQSILRLANRLNLPRQQLNEWAFDMFKKNSNELTDVELEKLLTSLEEELGRSGNLGA